MSERERLAAELDKCGPYEYIGETYYSVPSEVMQQVFGLLRESGGQGEAEMIRAGLWMAHYEVDSKEEACIEALIALPDAELLQRAGLAEKVYAAMAGGIVIPENGGDPRGTASTTVAPSAAAPTECPSGHGKLIQIDDLRTCDICKYTVDAPSAAGEESTIHWECQRCLLKWEGGDNICMQCGTNAHVKGSVAHPSAGASEYQYTESHRGMSDSEELSAFDVEVMCEAFKEYVPLMSRAHIDALRDLALRQANAREHGLAFTFSEVKRIKSESYSAGLEAAVKMCDELAVNGVPNNSFGPQPAFAGDCAKSIRSALAGKEANS